MENVVFDKEWKDAKRDLVLRVVKDMNDILDAAIYENQMGSTTKAEDSTTQ